MNMVMKLLAGLALLSVTLATPSVAEPGNGAKRAIAKADSARTKGYASKPRSASDAYSRSAPASTGPQVDTTICY